MVSSKAVPGNVYVNLDQTLPPSLSLRQGQNLVFLRDFDCAGAPFLRSLKMPAPFFVTADEIPYGTRLPGQPKGSYIAGFGLVSAAGTGQILIRFESNSSAPKRKLVRLKFSIS